jgi:5-methylcytosine-specific restriction endonuclease McrA
VFKHGDEVDQNNIGMRQVDSGANDFCWRAKRKSTYDDLVDDTVTAYTQADNMKCADSSSLI